MFYRHFALLVKQCVDKLDEICLFLDSYRKKSFEKTLCIWVYIWYKRKKTMINQKLYKDGDGRL